MAVGNSPASEWRAIQNLEELVASTVRPWTELPTNTVEEFHRDGVAVLRQAFTEWVEPLRVGLQRNLENPERFAFPCESNSEDES